MPPSVGDILSITTAQRNSSNRQTIHNYMECASQNCRNTPNYAAADFGGVCCSGSLQLTRIVRGSATFPTISAQRNSSNRQTIVSYMQRAGENSRNNPNDAAAD